ncbi:MAG: spermidine/putrescine ABC transporter substrate-binding protein PotD [Thiothrix lacustris]|uniref:Putrescine-binding periplasmic protein n=1 Tax=Thiothrix lacustris TaxID=525917 RepID=A0A1Y1QY75_9GAMM|nr:MAG: spermidine/putrescine ABC transporter substrate-binding protein PotD [Thiothrix lacustris]
MLRHVIVSSVLITLALLAKSPLSWAEEAVIYDKVIVYNWLDYIPAGVLDDFTKETGIKVEYSTFDSAEVMYARLKLLKGRGYDVLVPPTHLVSRMRDEGLLHPLDHSQLANFKHLDPLLLNQSFDPKNAYSIPFLWGSTGIGIDSAKINGGNIKKWADLWQKQWRGKLLLTDDMREIFHIALRMKGYSTNTTNPEEIKQAYEKLRQLKPNIKLISVNPNDDFKDGKANIGVTWNGEIASLQAEIPTMQYIYPQEGASFWMDSFVITSRSQNVDNAHKFIDYMQRPDIAARCVTELGYASSNLAAKALLDKAILKNSIIYPSSNVMATLEFKKDVGKTMELYELYWGKLKGGD